MSKGKNALLWALQVLGAAMFFMSGFMKLSRNEQMVQMFEAIGVGQWFRYVTGLIEFSSAILLLIPALSGGRSAFAYSNQDRSDSHAPFHCRWQSGSARRFIDRHGRCGLGSMG